MAQKQQRHADEYGGQDPVLPWVKVVASSKRRVFARAASHTILFPNMIFYFSLLDLASPTTSLFWYLLRLSSNWVPKQDCNTVLDFDALRVYASVALVWGSKAEKRKFCYLSRTFDVRKVCKVKISTKPDECR